MVSSSPATSAAPAVTLDAVVNLCKARGFVFASAEAHGGSRGMYDYGPLGVLLKNAVRELWWSVFVLQRTDVWPIDAAVMSPAKLWQASGHLTAFVDPLTSCTDCKRRHRSDKLADRLRCPDCGGPLDAKDTPFNLLFGTHAGSTASPGSSVNSYLRPETAQGVFSNFDSIVRSMRLTRLPFGIASTGLAFRNEISPRDFLFRMRQFEQAELEWFCTADAVQSEFQRWVETCKAFVTRLLAHAGEDSVRLHRHAKADLAHYSDACVDIEYRYPFGWGELWGIACRGEYDLRAHNQRNELGASVIEPSVGLDRLVLALLCDAMRTGDGVLRLHPRIAPVKFAVLPLVKRDGQAERAAALASSLRKQTHLVGVYDEAGTIGKRYRRYDEIGVPFCVTVDGDSMHGDGSVTVRERDTGAQRRVQPALLGQMLRDSQTFELV